MSSDSKPIERRFVSLRDAATYTGISVDKLEFGIRQGFLRVYRPFGRKRLVDLQELDQVVRGSVEPTQGS